MAICYAKLVHVKRSEGKNMVLKSAYAGKLRLEFEGNSVASPCYHDWSKHRNSKNIISHSILLPDHVDKRFKDASILWNEVEKFEKRKDAQIGYDFLIALPDDKVISNEQRIEMAQRFAHKYFVSKGYGVQVDVHPPSQRKSYQKNIEDDQQINEKNWHAHILITSRHFSADGTKFNKKKSNDLNPEVRGSKHFAFDGIEWFKLWTQFQNEYFQEKGLDLRVDQPGLIAQKHLGPVRMRGKNGYAILEVNDKREELSQLISQDPIYILKKLTENKSIFVEADLEFFLQKFASDYLIPETREAFWKTAPFVQLFDKDTCQATNKFTSLEVIEEERHILRLSERIHQKLALTTQQTTAANALNKEQSEAFHQIVGGSRFACIEGLAGTGKSYLLVALKQHYEENGYRVRAFGPDNATVRVLQEKGFKDASNIHRFLYKNHFSKKNYISQGKEVWLIDESSKVGNSSLLELLKSAEKSNIQVVFAGNSAQLSSVDRGGMFEVFCKHYGHVYLGDIQRQKNLVDRDISKRLAHGDVSNAIDLIAGTGGFTWCLDNNDALLQLIEKWAEDRLHFPYSSSMIIAHTNQEVREANDLVHTVRRARGEVSEKEFDCLTVNGNIRVGEGDLIEFRENSKKLNVRNGQQGILIKATENKFTIASEGKEISFDPKKYTSFQLGYATTCFRSQGATVDFCYTKYHPRMHQKFLYVAKSRHVRKSHCFVSRTQASCVADIKRQVLGKKDSETTISYTTHEEIENMKKLRSRENGLEKLCESDSLLLRSKGYTGKVWDYLKSSVESFATKVMDTRDKKNFYEVAEKQPVPGKVYTVNEEKVRMDSFKSDEIVANSQAVKKPSTSAFQKLSEEKKALFKQYFEKSENASLLHSIVKAESSSTISKESTASFNEWQKVCVERNMAASELLRKGSSFKEILGQKGVDILQERAKKYQHSIQPKDSIEVKLTENMEALLYKLFPEGPQRRDSRGFRFGSKGSLAVTCAGEKMGLYYNHETKEGGNLLGLIERKMGLNRSDALSWAKGFLEESKCATIPSHFSIASFKATKDENWISMMPPKGEDVPSLASISRYLNTQYRLAAVYPYKNEKGDPVFYTLRLESIDNGKKIVLPLSYGMFHADQNPSWKFKGHSDKREILYNTHLVHQFPQKPVLVVEGEKTADAANKLLGKDYVVVSWVGGSAAAKDANWKMLQGREVLIWPDNDVAGFEAASDISKALREEGIKSLKVVSSETLKDFPKKWDLADQLPEGKTQKFIEDSLLRAESKAIGIDRIHALAKQNGMTFQQVNEVVCKVDNSLREGLEKAHGSKTWEIDAGILSETNKYLLEVRNPIHRGSDVRRQSQQIDHPIKSRDLSISID